MNRILSFVLFVSIACLIYFFMHFFIFKILVKHLLLPGKSIKLIRLIFIFSGLSFPISVLLSRSLRFYLLNHYAFIWLGIAAIAFTVCLVIGLAFLIFPGKKQLIAVIGLSIIGIISLYSLFNGLRPPVVKSVTISLKNLPGKLKGFSIVQLSDLHLEPYKSRRILSSIVEKVNALKPDLIVITGDLIEGDIQLDSKSNNGENHFIAELKKLKAAYGVVAITGNHEFYAGMQHFYKLAETLNFEILRNRLLKIENCLQIIGIDDDEAKRFGQKGPDLDSLIKECDRTKPIILLYHRPTGFAAAAAKGVDLQLSGHSHAGQIPPIDILVHLVYKYPAGLYEKNGSYIYTSPGAGYWGPPMRFLSRNEITHIILDNK